MFWPVCHIYLDILIIMQRCECVMPGVACLCVGVGCHEVHRNVEGTGNYEYHVLRRKLTPRYE